MENNQNNLSCCQNKPIGPKGFWPGVCYGLIPHFPCLAFIVFSVLGVTFAASIFRPLMISRYFFYGLIGLSLLLTSLVALFYLKKNKILNWSGINQAKKYLLTLYLTTIIINIFFFFVIFPALAILNNNFDEMVQGSNFITLKVDLPCPGHAYLMVGDFEKIPGVNNINFKMPNLFDISFDPTVVSAQQILDIDILKIYQSQIVSQGINGDACLLQ